MEQGILSKENPVSTYFDVDLVATRGRHIGTAPKRYPRNTPHGKLVVAVMRSVTGQEVAVDVSRERDYIAMYTLYSEGAWTQMTLYHVDENMWTKPSSQGATLNA